MEIKLSAAELKRAKRDVRYFALKVMHLELVDAQVKYIEQIEKGKLVPMPRVAGKATVTRVINRRRWYFDGRDEGTLAS